MIPRDPAVPFVLLDDMRRTGARPARLYVDPVEIVAAATQAEVAPALARLRAAGARGLHAAGYLTFEAGAATAGSRGAAPPAAPGPLLWFGLFDACTEVPADEVPALLPDPAGAWAGAPRPLIGFADYARQVAAAKALIAAGDIYQANFTFPCTVPVAGGRLALYARLRAAAAAPWGALVVTGTHWLMSFSPELFFTVAGGTVTARPMKGTLARDGDPATLAADPKQRAENLMIVDLLRNDLTRIARPGSVRVPALFTVETYPTVHQMTSTVTAALAADCDAVDVLAAAFPCGSVTGAPKLRAMEVIGDLESTPRGPYTGSIGHLAPDGSAAFNVAIRTLVLDRDDPVAQLGLGSGIVADSVIGDEWRECLAKGAFVTSAMPIIDLIETMRFDALEGLIDLDRHIERMGASAQQLGFVFNRHEVRNELQAATFKLRKDSRVRLMVAQSGAIAIETSRLPTPAAEPVDVTLAPLPVAADDFRLRHKTSDRAFLRESTRGGFETVFLDPDGFVTEGSFTNVFVARDDGLITPPLARGLMAGVLRRRLIEEGKAREGDVVSADLAEGFYIGNSLRGLIRARLVAAPVAAGL